jgi:hypothetical protein
MVRPLGLAALGLGAIAVASRRAAVSKDQFYEWSGEHVTVPDAAGRPVSLPQVFHRTELIISVHQADFARVRAAVPTDALHPVRLPGGRALVVVSAARYLEGTAEDTDPRELPYGEIMLSTLVTREPAPPLVPILRTLLPAGGTAASGGFLLHMAVTGRRSRDAARALGYPAFVADLAFEEDLVERRVRLSEGGRDILRLSVATRGRITADRRPTIVYGARGNELLETIAPVSGYAQQSFGRRAGHLELGDHPVADSLRDLEVSSDPLVTRSYLNLRIVVPPPRVIGEARPYTGYEGSDREVGAYSILYPGAPAIDLGAGPSTRPAARRTSRQPSA